jgi:SAM-dependent methyltransferase
MLKIDIGCGPNKKPDHIGIDQYAFPGVDHVFDVANEGAAWPFEDQSIDEAWSSHFLEHLDARGRCRFANELFRVMKPGAKAFLIVPHWASNRAFGDPTHAWPPVSEMWPLYLNRMWRMGSPDAAPPVPANAPHTDRSRLPWGYDCDFDVISTPAGLHPICNGRNQEWLQFAVVAYKEVITDMQITLTRR